MNILCTCCKADSGQASFSGMNICETTGYTPVFENSNGLAIRWVCPACVVEIVPHIAAIVKRFGGVEQVRYLHFPHLLAMAFPEGDHA